MTSYKYFNVYAAAVLAFRKIGIEQAVGDSAGSPGPVAWEGDSDTDHEVPNLI